MSQSKTTIQTKYTNLTIERSCQSQTSSLAPTQSQSPIANNVLISILNFGKILKMKNTESALILLKLLVLELTFQQLHHIIQDWMICQREHYLESFHQRSRHLENNRQPSHKLLTEISLIKQELFNIYLSSRPCRFSQDRSQKRWFSCANRTNHSNQSTFRGCQGNILHSQSNGFRTFFFPFLKTELVSEERRLTEIA